MGTILIALSFLAIQTTYAAPAITSQTAEHESMQAALDARNEFVSALKNREYSEIVHQGFDVAIQELAEQLRADFNDQALANELISNWEVTSPRFAGALTMRTIDLGDHAPLFPWIDQFLKRASDRLGTIIYTLQIVKDIQTLNYALPIVFAPRGAWQTDGAVEDVDLRIEYRKHFIPFANLVTYYVTFYRCQYASKKAGLNLTKICKLAAERLEFAMGRYLAPLISDWIFKSANRPLSINSARLRYTTVDELRRSIQN